MIWTSGSRHCGSWSPATRSGLSTLMGTSWMMTVSLLLPKALSKADESNPSSLFAVAGNALYVLDEDVVTMVRARTGMLSFFVRRIWADEAFKAVFRARLRELRGTSRFITLFAADWML